MRPARAGGLHVKALGISTDRGIRRNGKRLDRRSQALSCCGWHDRAEVRAGEASGGVPHRNCGGCEYDALGSDGITDCEMSAASGAQGVPWSDRPGVRRRPRRHLLGLSLVRRTRQYQKLERHALGLHDQGRSALKERGDQRLNSMSNGRAVSAARSSSTVLARRSQRR